MELLCRKRTKGRPSKGHPTHISGQAPFIIYIQAFSNFSLNNNFYVPQTMPFPKYSIQFQISEPLLLLFLQCRIYLSLLFSTCPVIPPCLQVLVKCHSKPSVTLDSSSQSCFLFPLSPHGLVLMPLFNIYHTLTCDNCLYPVFPTRL